MEFAALVAIMRRLRDPNDGCPWDLEQTFDTIAPYTIEEAYEVADAIARSDLAHLRDELGDLLFQVVFHAQLASEQRAFDIDDVVAGICEKMQRRHPHVFGDAQVGSAAEQTVAWEEHKRRERGAAARSELDGVPLALPALTRAVKFGRRAARVGFDWRNATDALAKVDEELAELREAVTAADQPSRIEAEIGDLLFAITNVCRHVGVDPERALRGANGRFESRFRAMEQEAASDGQALGDLGLEELDRLWNRAKHRERQSPQ